jgi:hypothetical protein
MNTTDTLSNMRSLLQCAAGANGVYTHTPENEQRTATFVAGQKLKRQKKNADEAEAARLVRVAEIQAAQAQTEAAKKTAEDKARRAAADEQARAQEYPTHQWR